MSAFVSGVGFPTGSPPATIKRSETGQVGERSDVVGTVTTAADPSLHFNLSNKNLYLPSLQTISAVYTVMKKNKSTVVK